MMAALEINLKPKLRIVNHKFPSLPGHSFRRKIKIKKEKKKKINILYIYILYRVWFAIAIIMPLLSSFSSEEGIESWSN